MKPNIIYILADDMGYGDISALNKNCPFKTKNFDSIAKTGIAFTDAHSSSAVCTPSRYSILTGRYNWRSELKQGVIGGYSPPIIENGRTTVADILKTQGYKTLAIGKWHLGMNFAKTPNFKPADDFNAWTGIDYAKKIENSPITKGFDYYFGISASLDMPPYIYIENDHFTALPTHKTEGTGKKFFRKGPTAPNFRQENVLDELTNKVLEKIDEHKNDPFFIYFPMPAPHTPILPAKKFIGKSQTNEYGDFVLHCDDVVGRITKKLIDLNLFENTILIYTSDNGCSPMADFKELAQFGHNPSYIFRGHKADIYEGGHRIPLLIQWPSYIPAGKICDKIVCLSDFFATIADLYTITLKDTHAEDSISNLPLWKNPDGASVRKDIVHQSIDGSLSIRKGFFKLEMCPGSGGWSYPQKGKEDPNAPRFQLYDLENDIGETTNIIENHPKHVAELRATLKKYILEGRSTKGQIQQNTGAQIWNAVQWLNE